MTVQAKATVTLVIDCNSSWSDTTTIDQVRRQAITDAEGALHKMINGQKPGCPITLVGKPKINIVQFDV